LAGILDPPNLYSHLEILDPNLLAEILDQPTLTSRNFWKYGSKIIWQKFSICQISSRIWIFSSQICWQKFSICQFPPRIKKRISETRALKLLAIPIQMYLAEILDLPNLFTYLEIIDPNLLAEIHELPNLISYQKLHI
jgi:hypothetical protein